MTRSIATGRAVKKNTVARSFSETWGRRMAEIGSHASTDMKAKSRRRRMVRRPWAIFSDGEARPWDVDANNGRPLFKPTAAHTEPITTPGNVISEGAARAPTTFASPNAAQATPTHRGHVLSQVMCMINAA
jgi:hypothetical protein